MIRHQAIGVDVELASRGDRSQTRNDFNRCRAVGEQWSALMAADRDEIPALSAIALQVGGCSFDET
jgi:hypothetical protein